MRWTAREVDFSKVPLPTVRRLVWSSHSRRSRRSAAIRPLTSQVGRSRSPGSHGGPHQRQLVAAGRQRECHRGLAGGGPRASSETKSGGCLVALSIWVIGRNDDGDEGIGEFLRGRVPFVSAQEATGFQAGGSVRAGQQYGCAAPGVPFADDRGNDGEKLVA